MSSGFSKYSLEPWLFKNLKKKGFTCPTPIQRQVIPFMLKEETDMVAMARTGSGKTGAFLIPLLQLLAKNYGHGEVKGVILAPSRELALQILSVAIELTKGTEFSLVGMTGGTPLAETFDRMASLRRLPDLIIATPGRLVHYIEESKSFDLLKSVDYVIIDEADRCFEMALVEQITGIYKYMKNPRISLFSATMPKNLLEFVKSGLMLKNPQVVRLDVDHQLSEDLRNYFFTLREADKEPVLLRLLADLKDRKGMVFVSTKHHAEYLSQLLKLTSIHHAVLYGSLDQTCRTDTMEDFRNDKINLLIVTDLASRGLDVPSVSFVVHYDFPTSEKLYIHRVGRTARFGASGDSYGFLTWEELPYFIDLSLYLDRPIGPDGLHLGSTPLSYFEDQEDRLQELLKSSYDLASMKQVTLNAMQQVRRTRSSASSLAYKRAKEYSIEYPSLTFPCHPFFKTDEDTSLKQAIQRYKPTDTLVPFKRRVRASAEPETSEEQPIVRSTCTVLRESGKYRDPEFYLSSSRSRKVVEDGISLKNATLQNFNDSDLLFDISAPQDKPKDLQVLKSKKEKGELYDDWKKKTKKSLPQVGQTKEAVPMRSFKRAAKKNNASRRKKNQKERGDRQKKKGKSK